MGDCTAIRQSPAWRLLPGLQRHTMTIVESTPWLPGLEVRVPASSDPRLRTPLRMLVRVCRPARSL